MFPDQLNGWKEVAAYIGKSVRAAQRWEEELGLPIHRIKTPAGQIVFARRSEIDEWMFKREELGGRRATAGIPPAPRRIPPVWFLVAGVAAVAIVLLAGIAAWMRAPAVGAGHPAAARFRLEGTTLQGITDEGRVAWSIDFAEAVQEPAIDWRPNLQPVQRGDIDGDGAAEALIVVSRPDRTAQEQLICVTAEGREEWRYTPSITLRFGEESFTGPWPIRDVLVAQAGPAAGVWVALAHSIWWPGAVVRIDAHGTASVRFVQSGSINALGLWPYEGRDAIVAAGVNNEHAGASVAVIDPSRPATSPQTPGSAFACRNCPAGAPLKYIVLPRSELNRLSRVPYNMAIGLAVSNSSMTVTTTEWHEPGMNAIYTLDGSLAPSLVTMSDGYWHLHRRLELSRAIDHDLLRCPDRREPRRVRIWEPRGGWREARAEAGGGAIPGAP